MNVTEVIAELRTQVKELIARIEWLETNKAKLETINATRVTGYSNLMDFDHLPHAEVIKVIRAFGGKWTKTPADNNTIHYETTLPDGKRIRCFQGQPPPSCRIIEVEEHVPAVTLPATTRKVKKMICSPEMGAVMAHAAAKVEANNQPA
jgi:hypothetical protein